VALLGHLEKGGAPAAGVPSALIDPTDVIALVLMALLSIRRVELKGTEARAFPGVAQTDFDGWFSAAVHARSLSINACFLKFVLNNAWFYAFRNRVSPRTLASGGAAVFFGWLILLGYSFWLSSRAKRRADALGIVIGRRLVEGPPDARPGH
jgi:hypothetical protein